MPVEMRTRLSFNRGMSRRLVYKGEPEQAWMDCVIGTCKGLYEPLSGGNRLRSVVPATNALTLAQGVLVTKERQSISWELRSSPNVQDSFSWLRKNHELVFISFIYAREMRHDLCHILLPICFGFFS